MITNLAVISVTVLLVFAFKSSILGNYKIPSSSMEPVVQVGDRVFANQLSYSCRVPFTDFSLNGYALPERGDIFIFKFPGEPSIDYVKRAIGLPGDRIEIDAGALVVNGSIVPTEKIEWGEADCDGEINEKCELWCERINDREYYIIRKKQHQFSESFGPVLVPEGCIFVLGDNRDDSHDSRIWGFVPVENVRAKVLVVYFSLADHPGLFSRIRWSRVGKMVR